MSETNTMKTFMKTILAVCVKRMEFRRAIQAAFLKHYQVVPVKGSHKFTRKEVFEKIEETLRLDGNLRRRHYITQCLREIGVVPIFARGYRWFRGIQLKEDSNETMPTVPKRD